MSDQRRIALIGGGIFAGLVVLLFSAWGVSALVGGDTVARNVSVEGTDIGGLSSDDLAAVATDFDQRLTTVPAELRVGDVVIPTTLHALGVRTDLEQFEEDAFAARSGGFVLVRPFRWLASFFTTEKIPISYLVDETTSIDNAEALVEGQLLEPTDPMFDVGPGGVTVIPGLDGNTIDFAATPAVVEAALEAGEPYVIEMVPLPLPPTADVAALEAVAAEANRAVSEPISVKLLDDEVRVEPEVLVSWLVLDDTPGAPSWEFDSNLIAETLRPLFPDLGDDDQRARFEIVDGKPVIVPGSESVLCCDTDSGDRLKAAALGPAPVPGDGDDPDDPPIRSVELAPAISDSTEGVAALEALGITEQISTFTTNHDCCQGRVRNIQRMAEIVRGHIIRPGEVFDLNEIVGRRTTENGFVPAGAIAEGVIESQVGGGVSQFTTTMFNASFFGGLEFVEYQAHSIYFSRYPRGREATISYPKPDFIVRNNSPYGILVWPTWTDTSITVTLYSTKWVDVEDIGRVETAQGACTRVTTTRELTYLDDGRKERDTVFAVYRPGEGLDCNGNSTRPTTTTTEDPATTESTGSTTATTAPTTESTAPSTEATTPPTEATTPPTEATTPTESTTG